MAGKKYNHLLPSDVWIVAYNLNSHIDAVKHRKPPKANAYLTSYKDQKTLVKEWIQLRSRAKRAKEIRHAYIKTLRNLGWTLESIGEAFTLTRERVRQLASTDCATLSLETNLPLPLPPEKPEPEKLGRAVRVIRIPDEETIARLKELQNKAKLVRGTYPQYRKEAEEYTFLLNHLINVERYSAYRLAKVLGINVSGIYARLVRYGYRETNGTSASYAKVANRQPLT
jgi:hypothetical protein